MSEVATTIALSAREDTFAMAVVEYGGNLAAAFKSAYPEADPTIASRAAREMIARPEIALRIKQLSEIVEEHAVVSFGSHMVQLAEIRDLAKATGQLNTALKAEVQRGTAAGYYQNKAPLNPGNAPAGPSVVINIGGSSNNVQEWAAKSGRVPLVVESPK